jgi:hypothetical protein
MWIRLETTLRRGDVHEFEQLQGALSGLLPGHLLVAHQGLDNLLAYRVDRIEGRHGLLKHHSDKAATQVLHLPLGEGIEALPFERDLSSHARSSFGQEPDQRAHGNALP